MIGSLFSLKVDDKIKLEILELKHIEEFYKVLMTNKEKLLKFVPSIENVNTEEDIEYFIKYSYDRFKKIRTDLKLGIFENDSIIGCISVDFENHNKKCELGYWLIPDFQGKGIMKLVLNSLSGFKFINF